MAGHNQPLHLLHIKMSRSLCFLSKHRSADLPDEFNLFASSGAGQHHHRPGQVAPPFHGLIALIRIGLGIKFQVAPNTPDDRPHSLQALCIRSSLRPHRRQASIRRARQPGQLQRLSAGFFIQPGIGQCQWYALGNTALHQLRPNLGFHENAHMRTKIRQKPTHGGRVIPGQPGLYIARTQMACTFGPASGR